MSEKKTIAVVGATGAQGGGLVRAILNDPKGGFHARAITRNAQSEKAKLLVERGAEVVEGDVGDLESLKKAFAGAYGAYCVTFYWEHLSPEKEIAHARTMAEAAKATGLEHVVWSTLEDTRQWVPLDDDRMPTLMEKYKVPHFDSKGEADKFFTDLDVPTTFLLTCFYWENLIHFGMGPQKGDDGSYAITLPMGDKKLPGIGTEDIGRCAYGIFKNRDKYLGRRIGICGAQPTGSEMASALGKALGIDVRYNQVSADVYRSFGFPGAEDLGNMFQFKRDFQDYYSGSRDADTARTLNPSLKSFEEWAEDNKSHIPV